MNSLLNTSFNHRGSDHLATLVFVPPVLPMLGCLRRKKQGEKDSLNFLTVLDRGVISITLMEPELVP